MSDLTLSLGLDTKAVDTELVKLRKKLADAGVSSLPKLNADVENSAARIKVLESEVEKLNLALEKTRQSGTRLPKQLNDIGGASVRASQGLSRVGHQSWKATQGQLALHSALRGVGGAMGSLWLTYGRYVTVMAAAMAITKSFKDSVTRGMDADFQAQFVATLQSKGTPELGLKNYIRDELIAISRQSVFTVNENAEALKKLSLAGIDATNGLSLLTTASNAAIFAQVGLGEATTMVLDTLNNFQLYSDDVNVLSDNFERVANVMSYTAITVNTSFADLAKAFVNITGVAGTFNIEIEEASALLQSLAQAGVRGPKAGTYVRNFLDDTLGAPISQKAEARFEQIGVKRYNPALVDEGEFGVAQYVDDLTKKLRELDFVKQQQAIRDLSNQRSRRVIRQELAQEISLVERTKAIAEGASGALTNLASGLTNTAKMSIMMAQAAYDAATTNAFAGNEDAFSEIGKRAQAIFNSPAFNEFLDAGVRGIGSFTNALLTMLEVVSQFQNELRVAMQAVMGLAAGAVVVSLTNKILGLAGALQAASEASKLAKAAAASGGKYVAPVALFNPIGAGVTVLTGVALYTNRVQRDHEEYMRTTDGIMAEIAKKEAELAEVANQRDSSSRGVGIMGIFGDRDYEQLYKRVAAELEMLKGRLKEASAEVSGFHRALVEAKFEPEQVRQYSAELARFAEQMSDKYGKGSEALEEFIAKSTGELQKLRGEDLFSFDSLTKQFEDALPVAQAFEQALATLPGVIASMEEGASKQQLQLYFEKIQIEADAAGIKAVQLGEALSLVKAVEFEKLLAQGVSVNASLQDQYNKATMTEGAYREFAYSSELAAVSQMRLASAMWAVKAAEVGIDESLAKRFKDLAELSERVANQMGEGVALRFSTPDKPKNTPRADNSAAREYEAVTKKLQDFTRAQLEAAGVVDALTEAQKLTLEVTEKYGAELKKLTPAQKAQVAALLAEANAASAAAEAFKKAKEETAAWVKFREDSIQPMVDANKQYQETLTNLELELASLRTGRDMKAEAARATNLSTAAMLENNAAVYEAAAAHFKLLGYQEDVVAAYNKLATEARTGANILRQTVETDATLEVAKAAKEFSDQLEKDLSDAIMRGFEDGKGFAENFRDVLKNYFNTLVLRPIVQAVVEPVAGKLTGALGIGGSSGGGGGGMPTSGIGSLAGKAMGGMSLGNMAATAAANATGTGLSGLVAATGGWGTGAGVAAGTGGAAMGAMGAVGAALPWIGGALAIGSLFGLGGKNKPTNSWQHTTRDLETGAILGQTNNPQSRRYSEANLRASDRLSQSAFELSEIVRAITGETAIGRVNFGVGTKDKDLTLDGKQVFRGRASVNELWKLFEKELIERSMESLPAAAQQVVSSMMDPLAELDGELDTLARALVLATSAAIDMRLPVEKVRDSQEDFTAKLGQTIPVTLAGYQALYESLDLTTAAGRNTAQTLKDLAPSFIELQEAMLSAVGTSYEELTGVVATALSGTQTSDQIAEAFNDMITNGIKAAASQETAQNIADLFLSGIIEPALSVLSGSSNVADAFQPGSLQGMTAQAKEQAKMFADMMNDPLVLSAFDELNAAFAEIALSMGTIEENSQGIQSALELIASLQKEVNELGLSDLDKELSRINDQTEEHISALEAWGQASYDNILAVEEWAQAMRKSAQAAEALRRMDRALQDVNQSLADLNKAVDIERSGITEAFELVRDALNEEITSFKDEISGVRGLFQRSYTAERDLLTSTASSEKDIINEKITSITELAKASETANANLRGLITSLESAVDVLRNISRLETLRYEEAVSQLDRSLISARSGNAPDADKFSKFIDTITGRTTDTYSSSFDFERDRLVQANKLEELAYLTSAQVTNEEQLVSNSNTQIQFLREQLTRIDEQLRVDLDRLSLMEKAATAQLNSLLGIDESIVSMDEAMRIVNELSGKYQKDHLKTLEAQLRSAESNYQNEMARLDAIVLNAQAQVDAVRANNMILGDVARQISVLAGNIQTALRAIAEANNTTPGFASGGYHRGGLRIVGEVGPELEATGPARYWSFDQTKRMMGTSESPDAAAHEVRMLRQEQSAQARAQVQLEARMVKLLERWERDGMPAERTGVE